MVGTRERRVWSLQSRISLMALSERTLKRVNFITNAPDFSPVVVSLHVSDGQFLPRGQVLGWKMETLPVVTKSWYRSLSLKKQELTRTRKGRGCQFWPEKGDVCCCVKVERGLTGVVGVWLQTVDHMVVCFQEHEVLCCVSVPDEDVATVRTAHYEVVAPKTRLLNLEIQKTHFMFHDLTPEGKSDIIDSLYLFSPPEGSIGHLARWCYLLSSNYLGTLQWLKISYFWTNSFRITQNIFMPFTITQRRTLSM